MRAVSVIRLITADDAPPLAELLRENREFLAPWNPVRPDEHFSVAGQQQLIADLLEAHRQGLAVPQVILDGTRIAGRVTLTNIVRGAFQSGTLGYWLGEAHTGRGLATHAVAEVLRIAFDEFGMHRVEAGTLVDNVRSQRVLERNGFERFGLAPRYLNIAGRWQDHLMFQVLNPAADG